MKLLIRGILFLSFLLTLQSGLQAQLDSLISHGLSGRVTFLNHQNVDLNPANLWRESENFSTAFEYAYSFPTSFDEFSLEIPIRIGRAEYTENDRIDDRLIYGLGANAMLGFQNYSWFLKPYVFVGAQLQGDDENDFYLYAPLGLGLNVRLTKGFDLILRSSMNVPLTDNDRRHVQHSIGIIGALGRGNYRRAKEEPLSLITEEDINASMKDKLKPDADSDGVPNDEDDCPEAAGLAIFNGCPDSDSDGVMDKDDLCPEQSGPIANGGCPKEASTTLDADGDGLTDNNDNCPNLAGPASNMGCPLPDADNDGVSDADDKCPSTPGFAKFEGCPDSDGDNVPDHKDICPDNVGLPRFGGCPDTDGDGIADPSDMCPTVAGTAANKGCPGSIVNSNPSTGSNPNTSSSSSSSSNSNSSYVTSSEAELLSLASQDIEFETAKAVIRSRSYSLLNQVAELLKRYPNYTLTISGHTDSIGSSTDNQRLSEKRAAACKAYLVSRGVSSSRIVSNGFGEKQPIADNRYSAGRKKNRRVEFRLN